MLYRLGIIFCLNLLLSFTAVAEVIESADYQYTSIEDGFVNYQNSDNKRRTISKSAAIKVAKSEVRGKVLSAKLIESKGPPVYRIKMLVGESRVRKVFVDGLSGKVIRIN